MAKAEPSALSAKGIKAIKHVWIISIYKRLTPVDKSVDKSVDNFSIEFRFMLSHFTSIDRFFI